MNCPNCAKDIQPIPFELKATYSSSKRPIEDNISWVKQVMSECVVTGTTQAKLSRLCLMGDWVIKNGERPTLQAVDMQFTQEELDRHWAWMKERKVLFEQVLADGKLLPKAISLPAGMTYLCNWCSYGERCHE
uniref:PD-(D/E)XK nuclease superfamily protein n=1 Tax=viral metagenome TaxID=1070528 RepID=A0A6M3JY41_9ZZZZ